MHPSDPVSRRGDASIRSLQTVQISPTVLATVWAARNRKCRSVGTMATDRQTDAPSSNSYLDLGMTRNENVTT